MNNYLSYVNTYNFINHIATSFIPNMSIEESSIVLNHFKENYYQDASLFRHNIYLQDLHTYRQLHNQFPTKSEFYLQYRTNCICVYSFNITDEMYIRAADFFMKNLGNILNLSCQDYYNFSEFVMIEHRDPASIQEFIAYVRRIAIAENNPDALFQNNDIVVRPVEPEKIEQIKQTARLMDMESLESCGICQDTIQNQEAVHLPCGHYFHSNENDCCGTIFKWFETNNKCPICRKEI